MIWMTSCCECCYDFLYGFRCDEFSGAVGSEVQHNSFATVRQSWKPERGDHASNIKRLYR